jgi:hypothetical protein
MASSSKRKRDKAFNSSFFSSEQRHIKLRQDESPSMQTQSDFTPSSGPHRRPPNTFTCIPNGDSNRQDIGNDSDDDLDQVIMAIDAKEGGTVGCCYYVAQEEKLHLFGDAQSGGTAIIETCECISRSIRIYLRILTLPWPLVKLEVNPTILLCSTRVDALTTTFQGGQIQGNGNRFR